MLDELIAQLLAQINAAFAGLRHAVDHVHHQMKTVEFVEHCHVERRGDGALFLVAANVDIVVIGAAIGQAMNQPRISVKGENDRRAFGEKRVEIGIAQAVRMLAFRLKSH